MAPTVTADATYTFTSGVDPEVTVDAAAGKIMLTLDAPTTAGLPGSSKWALWLDPDTPDADVLVAGSVVVTQVVRP
jgi:hypothetical protein